MNGKNVLDGLDLDNHRFFDKEIDTVTELNRNPVVSNRKDVFDLEADTEFAQFVRHADPVRPLKQSWPQSGMNSIGGIQNEVREVAMNEMISVSSVRVRALRGSAFDTQREDHRQCQS